MSLALWFSTNPTDMWAAAKAILWKNPTLKKNKMCSIKWRKKKQLPILVSLGVFTCDPNTWICIQDSFQQTPIQHPSSGRDPSEEWSLQLLNCTVLYADTRFITYCQHTSTFGSMACHCAGVPVKEWFIPLLDFLALQLIYNLCSVFVCLFVCLSMKAFTPQR